MTEITIERRAAELLQKVATLRQQLVGQVIGQEQLIDDLLVAILAGGHVLLEGLPGLGKTLSAILIARMLKAQKIVVLCPQGGPVRLGAAS